MLNNKWNSPIVSLKSTIESDRIKVPIEYTATYIIWDCYVLLLFYLINHISHVTIISDVSYTIIHRQQLRVKFDKLKVFQQQWKRTERRSDAATFHFCVRRPACRLLLRLLFVTVFMSAVAGWHSLIC